MSGSSKQSGAVFFNLERMMLFKTTMIAAMLLLAAPSIAAERTLVDDKGQSAVLLEVENGFFRYQNAAFAYSVDVPGLFDCAVVISDNNDGIVLETRDKQARLSIYAAIDVSEKDVAQPQTAIAALQNELGDKIVSQKTDADFYTVIWKEGKTEFYRRIVYQNGVFFTMNMQYPSALKKQYEPMASRFESSLAIDD